MLTHEKINFAEVQLCFFTHNVVFLIDIIAQILLMLKLDQQWLQAGQISMAGAAVVAPAVQAYAWMHLVVELQVVVLSTVRGEAQEDLI